MKTAPVYMPHAGHLIVWHQCRFHLNTYVNGYIVSTVGEWLPSEMVREIFAECRKIELVGRGDEREADYMKKIGFEEIGAGRKYETMVFRGGPSKDACCPYAATDFSEIDCEGYNDPGEAAAGHRRMVEKYEKESENVGPK